METYSNIALDKKVTFRIGGVAENYYVPESVEELSTLCKELLCEDYYILSGGSNLLINDEKVFKYVIQCSKFDNSLIHIGGGKFYIGASNRIQKVIAFVNDEGYGGFEELIGLPALFGGIIYMNAGIGGKNTVQFNISDFIIRIRVIKRDTGDETWIDKDECCFGYRKSLFQNNAYIIIGAEIKLEKQSVEISNMRKKNRRLLIKEKQEWGHGCFGSCFSSYNSTIIKIVYLLFSIQPTKRVYQSKNNPNWLVNSGNGCFRDAMRIIKTVECLHRLFGEKIEKEIVVWQ